MGPSLLAALLLLVGETLPTQEQALREAIATRPQAAGLAAGDRFNLRSLSCEPIEEEPTEYFCKFEMQLLEREWHRYTAIVTYDRGWILLDWDDGH